MKFYNYDFVFIQKLTTVTPNYRNIYFKRIMDDNGVEMTFDLFVSLFKKFVKNVYDAISMSGDDYPEQVIDAITSFLSAESYDQGSLNNFLSIIKYWNYEFLVIGRMDANDSPKEVSEEYSKRTYLINNYEFNTIGIPAFYIGYSITYLNQDSYPFAMEYIDVFGLTSNQMEMFDLDVARKTFDSLKSRDYLKIFDDSNMLSFVESRGYRYLVIDKISFV